MVATALRLGQSLALDMVGTLRKPFAIADLEALLALKTSAHYAPTLEELRSALDAGQIVAYFQPKVCLRGEESPAICQAEALARWVHPDHGLLAPGSFIDLAEQGGLIDQLTWTMLEHGARAAVRWREAGLAVQVSVNVTVAVVEDLDYPDRAAEAVRRLGAEPEWLVLEITESGAMRDSEQAMDVLTRLRLKGFNLSCDDFGTGYSSLVQLYRLPFCELKIDRSFVSDCMVHEEARTIIRASVDLGHNLDLSVCAEGVESEAVYDFLRAVGCDTIQGFYVGHPVEPEAFVELAGSAVRRLRGET